MQRRNRDINIFSMSALDLFASALGAFILLFMVVVPYYLKTDPQVIQENARLKGEVARLQEELRQAQAATASAEQKQRAAFLGINTQAKSFVLVLDMSGSMQAYAGIVRDTVKRIFEHFDASHRVQILGFQEAGLHPWQVPYGLASMIPSNLQAGQAFVSRLESQFAGGTPTQQALLEALKYDAEAILLLTDGAPTDAPPEAILRRVTAENAGRAEIHAVAIGEYNAQPELILFLQALARLNRGAFVGVDK